MNDKLIVDSFLCLFVGNKRNLCGAKNTIKKARKGEINNAPEIPEGETLGTLIQLKENLIKEYKREPLKEVITYLMDKKYTLRRKEIVSSVPLKHFYKSWPMLFTLEQVI